MIKSIHQIVIEVRKETGRNIQLFNYGEILNNGQINFFQFYPENIINPELIVCYSTEPGLNYQENVIKSISLIRKKLNTRNTISIVGGIYPKDQITHSYQRLIYPTSNLYWVHRVAESNDSVDYSNCNTRPFLFDCLLGGKRWYRIKLFEALKQRNLLDCSLVCLKTNKAKRSSFPDYETPSLFDLERPEIQKFKLNWTNDFHTVNYITITKSNGEKFPTQMSCVISPKIYQNSWFSIVAETYFDWYPQKENFITEKTGKCLFAKRIFVCFAVPNHLKRLHELGFKTFDGIIDESYDREQNHDKRFEMICKQIEWLSQQNPIELYKQAEPILEHNFRMMTETDLGNQQIKEFILTHVRNLSK